MQSLSTKASFVPFSTCPSASLLSSLFKKQVGSAVEKAAKDVDKSVSAHATPAVSAYASVSSMTVCTRI